METHSDLLNVDLTNIQNSISLFYVNIISSFLLQLTLVSKVNTRHCGEITLVLAMCGQWRYPFASHVFMHINLNY